MVLIVPKAADERLAVREASAADAGIVGELVDAMDAHYLGPERTEGIAKATAMARRTLEGREGTRFLVALDGGVPVGIAIFAVLRPGHRLSGLVYLKDLFVVPVDRRKGVGRALFAELARIARKEGLGRIDFTVERNNVDAKRLYRRLGATKQDKLAFRIDAEAMARLAGGSD